MATIRSKICSFVRSSRIWCAFCAAGRQRSTGGEGPCAIAADHRTVGVGVLEQLGEYEAFAGEQREQPAQPGGERGARCLRIVGDGSVAEHVDLVDVAGFEELLTSGEVAVEGGHADACASPRWPSAPESRPTPTSLRGLRLVSVPPMRQALVRFARDGDPGWTAYDAEGRRVMVFDDELREVPDARNDAPLLGLFGGGDCW